MGTQKGNRDDLRVTVTSKSVLVTEAMKDYAIEKVSKIDKFYDHFLDIRITLDVDKLVHHVAVVVKFPHFHVNVEASTPDMYASIDQAADRLCTIMRRWKDRIRDHHRKEVTSIDTAVHVLESPDEIAEINWEIENSSKKPSVPSVPKVVGTEIYQLKTLTSEEAMMKLELTGDPFLLFRSEEDHKLKIIYRRPDGNYGLICPEIAH